MRMTFASLAALALTWAAVGCTNQPGESVAAADQKSALPPDKAAPVVLDVPGMT